MEKVSLDLLVRRTISDPVFRSQLLANPEVAVSEAGWDLSPEDMKALCAWHASLQNVTKIEELERSLTEFVAGRQPKV